jgi:hypothetical protein
MGRGKASCPPLRPRPHPGGASTKSSLPSGSDWLYSVADIGRSDAWATGAHYTDGATRARLLVEHYNGHRWRQVVIPADLAAINPAAEIRVGASSPSNVWVFELLAGNKQRILRWDGRSWHLTTAPSWVLRGNPRGI